jgi:hypothetical protein
MYPMRKSIVGVSGMGWTSQRASGRALAWLAVFGVGGIAGLLAAFSAEPVQTSELSPAEIVALRFPGGASRVASNPIVRPPAPAEIDSAPAGYVLASAAEPARYVLAGAAEADPQASSLLFSPFLTYSTFPRSAAPPQLVTASVHIPAEALAYAAPQADERVEPVMLAARPEGSSAEPTAAKRTIQPPRPASPSPASQGPASPSNALLNNAQIASIRERLKLTSYQDQLWPPVESALRDISWHQGHADPGRKLVSNARGATIDPNSVPVQRLKSAAFPLIMSLSDDQKQEVRTMVRLMGLENLASQF